jgi:hypothetical protein
VQSSDGADLAALVVSLALLIIEPYFRTTKGFFALLEREWFAAGCSYVPPLIASKNIDHTFCLHHISILYILRREARAVFCHSPLT